MKKAKKLGLQSLALVLMAFVLVAGVAFGMTGAWFTDGHKNQSATLQFNEVAITVSDAGNVHAYRAADTTHTTAKDTAVMPGDNIYGTFTIAKAAATKADFYYVVIIEATGDGIDATAKGLIEANSITTATLVDDAEADTVTINVPLVGATYGDSYENKTFQITWTVRAIQADNVSESQATAALNATNFTFDGQTYTGTGLFTLAA